MLWDVTDKDLDRLCLRLWEHLSENDSQSTASSAALCATDAESTPREGAGRQNEQYSFAAAATSRRNDTAGNENRAAAVGLSIADSRQPEDTGVVGQHRARISNKQSSGTTSTSLAQALERGRLATKLKSLTGAAAVLYGLPLRVLPLQHTPNILLRSRSNQITKH